MDNRRSDNGEPTVADTISSLAMNALVFYLEVVLKPLPPPKEQKLGEKSFWTPISSYGWTCKEDQNKAGMKKLKNTTYMYYGMMALSSLAAKVN